MAYASTSMRPVNNPSDSLGADSSLYTREPQDLSCIPANNPSISLMADSSLYTREPKNLPSSSEEGAPSGAEGEK